MSDRRSLWARTGPHREADVRPQRRRPGEGPHEQPAPEPVVPAATWKRLAAGAAVVAALAVGLVAFDGGDRAADEADAPLAKATGGAPPRTDVGRVAAQASPGVVSVQVARGGQAASGTGFVVSRDGTIVTNAHVVGASARAQVRFRDGGRLVDAEVLGTDASSDLAVLKVDPGDAGTLRPLPLGDSDDVAVGDTVVAIGHPFRLDRTVTSGIVSGVGREIEAPNGFQIDEVIQTDAAINPGNSGGPLMDARGRVIGVNSQIATEAGRGNVGIGFAVPSNTVRDLVPRLKRGQRIARPYLGISSSPATSGGAEIQEVIPGGPAGGAGIETGDVVTSVAGQRVEAPEDILSAIGGKRPGETVEVEVRRGGSTRSFEVKLGRRPERSP